MTLNESLLAVIQREPAGAVTLRAKLADQIAPVAKQHGARPTDVLARALLQLNDQGAITYDKKRDCWLRAQRR